MLRNVQHCTQKHKPENKDKVNDKYIKYNAVKKNGQIRDKGTSVGRSLGVRLASCD